MKILYVYKNSALELGTLDRIKKLYTNIKSYDLKIPRSINNLNDINRLVNHNKYKDLDLILHGHTHRYRYETIGGVVVFNPGECAGIMKGKNAIGIGNLNDLSFERIFF